MTIVVLSDPSTASEARIAVNQGFNCFAFRAAWAEDNAFDVLDAADGFENGDKPPSHSGIPLLFPFPNRIRSGRFEWEGKTYELPESLVGYEGSGNAIHGFCLDRPWRIIDQSENSVTGAFRTSLDAPERLELWPADAEIQIRYTLKDACLRADITITNPSDQPLPWGIWYSRIFSPAVIRRQRCGRLYGICSREAAVGTGRVSSNWTHH